MAHFLVYLAPLALMLPAVPAALDGDAAHIKPKPDAGETLKKSDRPVGWLSFDGIVSPQVQHQVRIEQRVVIRIAPRSPTRQNLVADLPRRGSSSSQIVERDAGKCLRLKDIAAVQSTRDNRLMLYLRDRRVMRANLEKKCSARDFYSGFYIEPNKDGKVCIKRDKLQSRTGAKCEVDAIKQLIAVDT